MRIRLSYDAPGEHVFLEVGGAEVQILEALLRTAHALKVEQKLLPRYLMDGGELPWMDSILSEIEEQLKKKPGAFFSVQKVYPLGIKRDWKP